MRSFYVVRSQWLRGGAGVEGSDLISALLDPESGKRCCLGFVAAQCGIPDTDTRNVPSPRGVREEHIDKWPDALRPRDNSHTNSPLAMLLMALNDTPLEVPVMISVGQGYRSMPGFDTERERESWISAIALTHGIMIEFRDSEEPDAPPVVYGPND